MQRGVHPSTEYFYSEFVLCNPSRVASEADMKYKHMVKHRSLLTQSSGGTSWKSVLKGWLEFSMIFVLRVKRDSLTGLLYTDGTYSLSQADMKCEIRPETEKC